MRPIVAALLLAAAATPAGAAASYYQEGLKLMRAERYHEAVIAFEKEAAENPGSAEVLMNLGWSYWKVNRIDEAWRCFDLLAKLDPKNAAYLRLLAETEISRKEYPHALEHARQALKLLPGDKMSSIVMASAYMGLQRHREAYEVLKGLVERYPDSGQVQFHMADALSAMGRLEEALARFDIVMRLEPDNRDYRRARANVMYALGHVAAAVAEWKALADGNPPDQKAIINLGWAAWKDRDVESAYKHALRLLELQPNNPTYLRFAANVQIERGDPADALRYAQRALDINGRDKDASLTKSKALFNMRRDKEAMAVLTELLRAYPDNQQIVFHMADFLDGMGKKAEALSFFGRLAAAYPENISYRHRRAQVLYDIGEFDKAVAEWKRLVERYPSEVKALTLLADDAVSREAWEEAIGYLREQAGRQPLDDATWMRMGLIYQKMKEYTQAIAAADKALALNPTNQASLYAKADILEVMGDWDAAEKVYHQLLERNPNSLRTLAALGRVAEQKGDYDRAIRLTRSVRKLSFSDSSASPYLDILEARLLADSGRIEKAMRVLKKKATRRRVSIPILVYHGVSRFERGDTMSVPAARFAEQMEAIKKAGFNPITVQELAKFWDGKGGLPDKPILITFDDARADAFANGHPILERNKLKATMYVHFAGGFKRSRYYAGIPELRKWKDTGVWEMQAHSEKAHDVVQVNRAGNKGHFLSNRMWLPAKQRLETIEEFKARIDADFRIAKEKLQGLFPETPMLSYAFPFGDLGQTDYSNTPEAPTLNWQAVHKYFRFSLTQDPHGYNRVPSKSTDMTRWTVKREYTARDVMRHLILNEPWTKAKMLEASFWVRTNQPGRALSIYRMLRMRGLDDAGLYGGEAVAFEMFGNGHVARKKWAQALERDPSVYRYRELMGYSDAKDGPRLGTEGRHFNDSFTRNTRLALRGSMPVRAARVEPWVGKAYFSNLEDDGATTRSVTADETGADLAWHVLPRVKLEGGWVGRRFNDGPRANTNSADGKLTFPFFAPFRLGVKGGVADVETRMAVGRGLFYRSLGALAEWDVGMNTTLQFDAERLSYSDGNRQRLLTALLSRRLGTAWTLGYAFRYGEADRRVAEYYSPGRTATHTGSVSFGAPFGGTDARRNLRLGRGSLTYSAGYGAQDRRSRFIQGVKGTASYRLLSDFVFSASAGYTQSPAYVSRTVGAGLGMEF